MKGFQHDLTSWRCTSGRVSFATRSRAKKRGKIAGRIIGKILRAYHCRICNAWHLYAFCMRRNQSEHGNTNGASNRAASIAAC